MPARRALPSSVSPDRRGRRASAATSGAIALALACACRQEPAPPVVQRTGTVVAGQADFRADDRLAHLLGGCARTDAFTADTSDLVPVLVEKLVTAPADVASRARQDLLAAGAAALPQLRRGFQRWFTAPGQAPRVLSVLEIVAAVGSPDARAMGLEALEHPSESVRGAAAKVLANAGSAQDYDTLARHLPRAGLELATQLGLAMLACDRPRLEQEYAAWVVDPARRRIAVLLAPRLAVGVDAAVASRVRAIENAPPEVAMWFGAAAAAAGDADALAAMRAALRGDNPVLRQLAVQALLGAGMAEEVAVLAAAPGDASLRTFAVEALGALPDSPARRDELRAALADRDEGVRRAALTVLCARGDAGALDRALDLLRGSSADLGLALSALRVPLEARPDLAREALEILVEELERGPRTEVRLVERAIGQIPLPEAARFLLDRARTTREVIQGFSGHRWYMLQAVNSGPSGRAVLRAAWAAEDDLLRRMDLIAAGCQSADPETRGFLEQVLDHPRASPWERLFAADLYARTVPAAQAAPLLKRIAFTVEDGDARRGFHCLLWRFYGPES